MNSTSTQNTYSPQAVKIIRDLETLRVLTDPLRMRILAHLRDQPRTVKEVAQILGLPHTRLYYHFNLLEKHGLIQVVSTRVVSGIIEKHYQVTAYEFNVDRALLSPKIANAPEGPWQQIIVQTIDTLQQDLTALAQNGTLQNFAKAADNETSPPPLRLSRTLAHLSPGQARAFAQRLQDLLAEFEAQNTPSNDAEAYTLFVAFYPTPPTSETSPNEPPTQP